jgi:hypothetical protein
MYGIYGSTRQPSKPTLPQATLLTRTVATKIFVIVIDARGIKCQ